MKRFLSLATAALLTSSASAGEIDFSGFMSAVVGKNDNKSLANGYMGYDDSMDASYGSVVGLQLNGKVDEKTSAVVQLVARGSDTSKQASAEWAYINYNITGTISGKFGRLRPAFYMYSDYLEVGAAYTWVKTPFEVYSQVPFSNIDGFLLSYSDYSGDYEYGVSVWAGTSDQEITLGAVKPVFHFQDMTGGEVSISNDYVKLRASYTAGTVSGDISEMLAPVNAAYEQMTGRPGNLQNHDELKVDDNKGSFGGIGMIVTLDELTLISEVTRRTMDKTIMSTVDSYYVTAAYTIGDFTPNITYANAKSDVDTYINNADPVEAAMVNNVLSQDNQDVTSTTLGLRYDLSLASAIKGEIVHTEFNAVDDDKRDSVNTMRLSLDVSF